VEYERNELDAALRHVTEGVPLCRQFVYTPPLSAGLATLAWIRQATGDPSGAREAMEQALRAAPARSVTVLLDPVPALRARLLLAQGDLAAAVRWTRERGLGSDDAVSYLREPEYLVLVRVLLAQDMPDRALALLDRLHALAAAQGRTGSVIETQALRAVTLAAAGDHTGAMATLTDTLTLASPQGYVRVFADEGAPMSALIGRLVEAQRSDRTAAGGVPLGFLGRLLRAFEHEAAHDVSSAGRREVGIPGLVKALTERELEVMRLLAEGKRNREIADELVVTVETVKKHTTHIFDKLYASNRTQAVARARDLGILSSD
jgi:LuxR family maltose regulon positive regulatory protein